MVDLILVNGEKIAKIAKINSLQNYPLYGTMYTCKTCSLPSLPPLLPSLFNPSLPLLPLTYFESYFCRQCVPVVYHGIAIFPVPAINLNTPATCLKNLTGKGQRREVKRERTSSKQIHVSMCILSQPIAIRVLQLWVL